MTMQVPKSNQRIYRWVWLLMAFIGLSAMPAVQVQVISFNIDWGGTIGGSGTAIDAGTMAVGSTSGQGGPGDFAGVVSVDCWGNSWYGSGQDFNPKNLIDDTGAQTPMDITSSFDFAFDTPVADGQDAAGTWNRNMLQGYMSGALGNQVYTRRLLTLRVVPFKEGTSGRHNPHGLRGV